MGRPVQPPASVERPFIIKLKPRPNRPPPEVACITLHHVVSPEDASNSTMIARVENFSESRVRDDVQRRASEIESVLQANEERMRLLESEDARDERRRHSLEEERRSLLERLSEMESDDSEDPADDLEMCASSGSESARSSPRSSPEPLATHVPPPVKIADVRPRRRPLVLPFATEQERRESYRRSRETRARVSQLLQRLVEDWNRRNRWRLQYAEIKRARTATNTVSSGKVYSNGEEQHGKAAVRAKEKRVNFEEHRFKGKMKEKRPGGGAGSQSFPPSRAPSLRLERSCRSRRQRRASSVIILTTMRSPRPTIPRRRMSLPSSPPRWTPRARSVLRSDTETRNGRLSRDVALEVPAVENEPEGRLVALERSNADSIRDSAALNLPSSSSDTHDADADVQRSRSAKRERPDSDADDQKPAKRQCPDS